MPPAAPASAAGPRSDAQSQPLQCMEIIGGNVATRTTISSPGLDIWLDSRPFEGRAGGDIHYLSACGSGRVTRVAVADVSGHGPSMNQIAQSLRRLMRKYINLLDQTRFARAINREFTQQADATYFATVLLVTYFAPTDHLIVCNAGHPRPIWYSTRLGRWELLKEDLPDVGPSIREAKGRYLLSRVANLPLGVIEPTDYRQFSVKLDRGDLVLIYTDGLIEALNGQGEHLGEQGLLRMAAEIGYVAPQTLAERLMQRVDDWRSHQPPQDDQTLLVLHHNANDPPRMTVGRAVRVLSKVLGISRV